MMHTIIRVLQSCLSKIFAYNRAIDCCITSYEKQTQNNVYCKSICYTLIVLSIFYALCNGLDIPNLDWTPGYYFPNIFDGVIRRSFLGTLLYIFGLDYNIYAIISFIYIMTFLCVISFVYAIRNHLLLGTCYIMIFFLSGYGENIFHSWNIGHPEYFHYLLLLTGLYFNRLSIYIFIAFLSLWIHEISIFTTVPIMFLSLWMQKKYKNVFILGAVSVLITGILYLYRNVSQTVYENLLKQYNQSNLEVPTATFDFLYKGGLYIFNYWNWNYQSTLILFFCAILFLLLFLRTHIINRLIALATMSSILIVGFIASDVWRWNIIFFMNFIIITFILRDYLNRKYVVIFLMIFGIISGKESGKLGRDMIFEQSLGLGNIENKYTTFYKMLGGKNTEININENDLQYTTLNQKNNYVVTYSSAKKHGLRCDGIYHLKLFNQGKLVYDKLTYLLYTKRYEHSIIEPNYDKAYIIPINDTKDCNNKKDLRKKEVSYKNTDLMTKKPAYTPWNKKGVEIIDRYGLIINFDKKQTTELIDISYEWNDAYRYTFKYKGKIVAEKPPARIRAGWGLILGELTFEKPITFDSVEINASAGDGNFSIGHFIPK